MREGFQLKKKDFTNTEITKVTLEDFKLEERR
jgi:hypothetical protein